MEHMKRVRDGEQLSDVSRDVLFILWDLTRECKKAPGSGCSVLGVVEQTPVHGGYRVSDGLQPKLSATGGVCSWSLRIERVKDRKKGSACNRAKNEMFGVE